MSDKDTANSSNGSQQQKHPSFGDRARSLLRTFMNHQGQCVRKNSSLMKNFYLYIQIEPVLEYIKKIKTLSKQSQIKYNWSKNTPENKKSKMQISLEQISDLRLKLKYSIPRMTNFDFDNSSLTVFVGQYRNNTRNLASMMDCPVINNKCITCFNNSEYATLKELNTMGAMLFKTEINLPNLSHYFLSGDCDTHIINEDSQPSDLGLDTEPSAPYMNPPAYKESQM